MFGPNEPYAADLALLKELGIKPFGYNEHDQSDHAVGIYTFPDGSTVEISVQCLPAQFWRFKIDAKESSRKYEVSTGSGTLSDYWPMVVKMVNGMFVVKSVEKVED